MLFLSASAGAAGYDLHTVEECLLLPAGGKALIPTGLAIQVPAGTYGRIAARSGLAFNAMVAAGGGTIDSDYTGEVKVILFNHGTVDVIFRRGERVAQLIFEKIEYPVWVEAAAIRPTPRGGQGFGSTGN